VTQRLAGKVAIVTGSAHGIGRASALIMAREAAKVCVADIDGAAVEKVADDIRKGGAAALHYCVDIGEEVDGGRPCTRLCSRTSTGSATAGLKAAGKVSTNSRVLDSADLNVA
jgi:3(or 17)beta-hydroxysteroid dehydrogenase